MPPANRFTLADLGFKEELLNSHNGFSAMITIDAPPDASFLGYRHQMFLVLETHTLPSAQGGWLYVFFTVSPGNSTKCVLTIAAGSPRALARLSHALFFEGALDKLTGDTAIWTQREIVCLNRTSRRRMHTVFYLADLEIWLRVNWIALPLILTGASGILFVGMRLMLDRYKRGR